eukprot:g55865.t1
MVGEAVDTVVGADRMTRRRRGPARPVICIDTGLTYASLGEAAAAHNVRIADLHDALHTGLRAGGFKWGYADGEK